MPAISDNLGHDSIVEEMKQTSARDMPSLKKVNDININNMINDPHHMTQTNQYANIAMNRKIKINDPFNSEMSREQQHFDLERYSNDNTQDNENLAHVTNNVSRLSHDHDDQTIVCGDLQSFRKFENISRNESMAKEMEREPSIVS